MEDTVGGRAWLEALDDDWEPIQVCLFVHADAFVLVQCLFVHADAFVLVQAADKLVCF